MASESMEWPVISRTSSITSDRVLVDIPDDDEFDECTGTPKIAAEHAAPSYLLGFHFQILHTLRLSAKHKTPDVASQDLEKPKAKPAIVPGRFEENIMQILIRRIFLWEQEKTLVLEVEESDTIADDKSNILKEMGIQRICKTAPCMLVTADDEILPYYSICSGRTLWLRYGYRYEQ